VRCFISVTPSASVRERAFALAERIVSCEANARPVLPGNMHVTLQFLGEIPAGMAETVSNALAGAVSGFPPFNAGFRGFGAFPSESNASVLWSRLDKGEGEITGLSRRIADATVGLGIKNGENRFLPHLTVARFRKPVNLSRLEVFSQLMQTEIGMFAIDRIALMHSDLTPAGPVYRELCSCGLKA